eukprot:PhM_4_TR18747/c0_g1_i1/m.1437
MAQREYKPKGVSNHPKDLGLPMLPGNNFHDQPICRSTIRKSHTLAMPRAVAPNAAPPAQYDYMNLPPGLQTRPSQRPSTMPPAPQEDIVLRFLAYFKESVPEGANENVRVRRVAIVYHDTDKTLLVREANQLNSGMSQGVLVRRQKVYKPGSEECYAPSDFYLGAEVVCHGVTFCIVDMDERTRKFYGNVPEQALPWPEEDIYNASTIPRAMTHKPKKQISTVDMDQRRQMEFAAAGSMSKHHPDDVRAAQQFLQTKLHQHLQFAAVWDDRSKRHGDCRLFVVRFFLENDTLEVSEARKENDGRDTTSNKVIGRMRVLKPNTTADLSVIDHQHDTFGLKLKSHYLTHKDLFVGATVDIHNKKFFLYDADSATREWYKEKEDVDLEPAVDISGTLNRDAPKPVVHVAPPPNGFGTEADSLQNWQYILLRPAKKDYDKLAREDGKVMRFSAVLHGDVSPEDESRGFVVNYYRATDEVEIIEQQVKNSGHIGGKFLGKGTHGRKYDPNSFYEGAVVTIQGRQFRLLEMDVASRKLVDGVVAPTTQERLRQLITLLRDLVSQRFYSAREAFRSIAPGGHVTSPILKTFFASCNTNITDEEAASIVAQFDVTGNGWWDFLTFRSAVDIGNSFSLDVMANRTTAIQETTMADAELISTLSSIAGDTESTLKTKQLTMMLRDKLLQRRGSVHELFRLLAGNAPNSTMSENEFRRGLIDLLHFQLKPSDFEVMVSVLFPPWRQGREVTLREFCDFVDNKKMYLKQ